MLRVVHKRQRSGVGITDLLVTVLLADAVQNAMSADASSLPEGIVLVGTIISRSYSLDWLGYRFPRLDHVTSPRPLLLIRGGRINRRNLDQEMISEAELMSQVRQQGITDISRIREAYMERDGRLSVITESGAPNGAPEKPLP